MIEPGEIFAPVGSKPGKGRELVVVYRVAKHGSVFYDGLNCGRSGAICHGHGSTGRFLAEYELVGRMRFEGAYQLYRKERLKVGAGRRMLRDVFCSLRRLGVVA